MVRTGPTMPDLVEMLRVEDRLRMMRLRAGPRIRNRLAAEREVREDVKMTELMYPLLTRLIRHSKKQEAVYAEVARPCQSAVNDRLVLSGGL